MNCGALPESLLESELFVHVKGAFTSANDAHTGRFERADGGTIFLDKIGDASPLFQTKLLRVLQLGEFERVGSSRVTKVDVRCIAATNLDLEAAVRTGSFRADLHYRLNVVPITSPPLRKRPDDIPVIAEAFAARLGNEGYPDLTIARDVFPILRRCPFPGNVRELENCLRRAAIFADGIRIRRENPACQSGDCPSRLLWSYLVRYKGWYR